MAEMFNKLVKIMENVINIIRWIVPIGLIVMTTKDVMKKVINPEDKEGQKKILIRLIAALIVFMIPVFVSLIMNIIEIGGGKTGGEIGGNEKGHTNPSEKTPVNIDDIELVCPKSLVSVGSNNSIGVNLPNNYNGQVTWHVDQGSEFLNIGSSNNKSFNYSVIKYPKNNNIVVSMTTSNITKYCSISVLKPNSIGGLEIINCPSSNTVFKKGDVIRVNAKVPDGYTGNLTWKVYTGYQNSLDIKGNGTSATITVLGYYQGAEHDVVVWGTGDMEATCTINIERD